jgi:hypothetical protein
MLHRVLNQTHIASKMIHIVLSSFVVSNRLMLCLCCAIFCETTHVTSNIYKYKYIYISSRILSFYLECYLYCMSFFLAILYQASSYKLDDIMAPYHGTTRVRSSRKPQRTKGDKSQVFPQQNNRIQ